MNPNMRITLAGLKAKSKSHAAQGNMLNVWGDMLQVDGMPHQLEVKFGRAYNAVDEVSSFPLDTNPANNADLDADTFKAKVDVAVSKMAEFKLELDGIQGKPGDKNKLDDAKTLLDDTIALIMSAKDNIKAVVDAKPALKAKGPEAAAEA